MAEYIERDELTLFLRNEIVECETAINNMENPYEHQLEEATVSGRMQAMVDIWRKVTNKATADVVEVVRCKECKYGDFYCNSILCGNAHAPWYNDEFDATMELDGYCSYGIRKEGAEE